MAILGPEIKYVFFFCKIFIAANQNVFFFSKRHENELHLLCVECILGRFHVCMFFSVCNQN